MRTPRKRSWRKPNTIFIPEPRLLFNYEQATEDPRDGLTLFGPLENGKPYGIRYATIGTSDGVRRFREWLVKLQLPIGNPDESARPAFPGFEAAFGIPWRPTPQFEVVVDEVELHQRINYEDKHHRVFKAVELYEEAILNTFTTEDSPVDVWFVIVPDDLYRNCKPQSTISKDCRIQSTGDLTPGMLAAAADGQSLLFENTLASEVATSYDFEVNFHNQLKARLLRKQIVTQIVRESTIAYQQVLNDNGRPLRDLSKFEQDIAWHLATAAFYKSGGRPWKINAMRDGVCYIGIVFKHVACSRDPQMACCAAQMFLDSGDGVVFKGNNGPWYTGRAGEFHIDENSARELATKAIETYRSKHPRKLPPKEIFMHGKTKFNEAEWKGFTSAATSETNVVAVQILQEFNPKLFRPGKNPVLRGIGLPIDEHLGYLWTRGLVPRLRTYIGKEVPNPLMVKVCRGNAEMKTVLTDILALTKLNYNACRFGDGEPVTLKFADAVGEILTAGPVYRDDIPPLPFKHYVWLGSKSPRTFVVYLRALRASAWNDSQGCVQYISHAETLRTRIESNFNFLRLAIPPTATFLANS
jgi:hypothetical protein